MEVPDYYSDVSLRLMKVLDSTELTEKMRWKRIEMYTQLEELWTVMRSEVTLKKHIFGSQAEGTTTSGLRSDIDIVSLYMPYTAIDNLQSWEPDSSAALMIMDDTTPPGYVKLQQVYANIPFPIYNLETDQLVVDTHGRSCLYNNSRHLKPGTFQELHGPAVSPNDSHRTNILVKSMDLVNAYRSHSWPCTASEWITRRREHNWPSQETISIIQQSGALLVPVGHKLSPEKHLEWRISLSYGEKMLIWQFNSTQYKCYVVLKMINNNFIKKRFGENVSTSYHWKTCMLYMIETTPAVIWQPKHLLLCIEMCLMKMCNWIEECNCPNYFIQAENMFLDKMNGPVQRSLSNILHDLIRQKGRYLTMIPYDGIGQKLNIACQSPITQINDEMKGITKPMSLLVDLTLASIRIVWFDLLRDGVQINSPILKGLSSHAVRQEIHTTLQKLYCSNLGSHVASQCMKQETVEQESLDMAHEFLQLGSSSDVASGKLKLATFYFLQNNGILAENILQNIEENYTFLVTTIPTEAIKDYIIFTIMNENISTTYIVRYYCAFPVPYLPSEMYCTPRALIPEMFRSTGSHQIALNPDKDYWQSWAVVDPKFYLYFLQYQCCHQQNKITHKMVALSNMIWVIRNEQLKYKDTALNLLAFCLKEDGFLVQSYSVLYTSMKLKNHHNAAKWQIAHLLNAAFRLLGGGQ